MLIGELEIFEQKPLFGGRNKMFVHKCLSELLLIIAKFIFIEIELIVGRDVWWSELFGEDSFRVNAS